MSRDSRALEVSLSKLDYFLSRLPSPFLSGNTMSHLDCEILPKLHHLRVAAGVLKGYQIPARLSSVWRYLHQGYNSPVFSKACPPDQEILLHWADRPDTPTISTEDHSMLTRYGNDKSDRGIVKMYVISISNFISGRHQNFHSTSPL